MKIKIKSYTENFMQSKFGAIQDNLFHFAHHTYVYDTIVL